MLNYFWGDNEIEARRAARVAVASARTSSPEALFIELAGENILLEQLQEVFYSQPLLGGATIVFLDQVFGGSDLNNFVADNLPTLISSPNQFIFFEGKTGAVLAKAIAKAGGEAKEFKLPVTNKQMDPATAKLFAVADAFGNRDRKRAWLLYHDARRDEIPAEEAFWKFAWKIKTLLMVETAKVGDVLPLKPYPLAQARGQVKKYKSGELARLSSRLIHLYHDARRGLTDFDFALERLILEL